MRYVLASGSPRRRELFSKVVPEYEVIPATGEEVTTKLLPSEIVEELSYQKASEIFYKNFTDSEDGLVVIGSDTVVSYNHRVLGKPTDRADAFKMVQMLQGQTHSVYTGVTVFYVEGSEAKSFTFRLTVLSASTLNISRKLTRKNLIPYSPWSAANLRITSVSPLIL